ncbi:MAG: gamma-glutamylcyclotransferase [Nanoarchaeota archaeon]|nr:gamma-glutamylcyclotransferase [Nanoarchaeota archaeon]
MVLYFAYGSNMLLSQIGKRLKNPDLSPCCVVYAEDRTLIFPRKSDKQKGGVASIEEKKDDKVFGAVFEITDEELKKLDSFEGYKKGCKNNRYEHREIELKKEDGTIIRAITYVANKKGIYLPSQYYMNKIIRGATECKLPETYIQKLKRIKTKVD